MFHRVKSENPQTDNNQPQARTQTQMSPRPQSAMPAPSQKQTTPPLAAPQPVMAKPPMQQQPPAPIQSLEKTPETFYQKESQPMTDTAQPKKNDMTSQDATAPRALDIPGGNAFQRQGQQPGWNAGNYPGYVAGVHAPGMGTQTSDNKLTIGRGITMAGEIKSCNHLVVEGTVEASLTGASVLEIAQSGTFLGTVEIEEATVAGNFEGDLTVSGRLVIRSTGSIKGSITYKELEVEAGALIEGRLMPVGAVGQDSGRSSRKSANNARSGARPSMRDAQKEAANNESEGLFSGNNSAAAE